MDGVEEWEVARVGELRPLGLFGSAAGEGAGGGQLAGLARR